MDADDKLKRLMQHSGLFDSEESTASDIGDYSASSEDEWTPTRTHDFKHNVPDLKNEKPPSPVDTLPLIYSSQLPSLSGITPKHMKQNESDNGDDIGCTSIQIRKMAYEYAVKNNLTHNFNENLGMAGKDWLIGFMKRNNLSNRKAEGTSLNRATAFNKDEVSLFFKLLGELMEKYRFLPRNIYNMDETGISSVQDPGKVVTEKGQKRVGSITSGERGKNVTAVCAVSATSVYLPPMLIFPRLRHSPALENDGPRGSIYRCSKNGWINEELFVDWLKHFANFTKPSDNEPILLILDNHSSHISLSAYEFCKTNNIIMLSLPPHGSHRIQPLDVSIYSPFKTAYKQECNLIMKTELGRKITHNDIASLFRKAFQKIATIPKTEAGFAATAIYPLNPEIFTEEDFLPAGVLNSSEFAAAIEERDINNKTPDQVIPLTTEQNISAPDSPSLLNCSIPKATTTFSQVLQLIMDNSVPTTSGVTAKDLLSVPKKLAINKKVLEASRKQHAKVLTSTPNKEALKEKEDRKVTRERKKENKGNAKRNTGKKTTTKRPAKTSVKKVKKRVLQESNNESSSESEIDMIDVRDDDDTDIEDLENKCMLCNDYGQNNELWYRCVQCGRWAHAECSDCDSAEGYVCDFCRLKA